MSRTAFFLSIPLLISALACGAPSAEPPTPVESPPVEASTPTPTPQDLFWNHLTALCGQAFAGAMVSDDEADQDLADQPMVMHVRRCAKDRLEIPFHIGENRSRTWVLTRLEDGIELKHHHRHEDGSDDAVTLYGGRTQDPGTEETQAFPVDDYSKELFEANGLSVSTTNVWSLELEPGQRFSYILRRPGRHFRADFDLSQAVAEPPAPWGATEGAP